VGVGADWGDNCTPDCATGLRTAFRVRLVISRPKTLDGEYVFTRIDGTYTHDVPPHSHRGFVMTLRYGRNDGGFFWAFST
jgi:hypothetical protein